MKKAIIGAGGFAREVYHSLSKEDKESCVFFVDAQYLKDSKDLCPCEVMDIVTFDPNKYEVVVAIANPKIREKMVDSLPKETKFYTHIHKSAIILGNDVFIGDGSIICAGCILTTNIYLGNHSHLNLGTTIGHDCNIGSFFTTAPGVMISGNNLIGRRVYFGTMAMTKEKLTLGDDIVLGMNAGVTKSIYESGTYIGTPAKKMA